jgi:hypothetical protein
MSSQAVTWALAQPIAEPGVKFVLVAIAHLACPKHKAFPSLNWLASATGQDVETVSAARRALVASGHIADTFERVGESRRGKVWRLAVGDEPVRAPLTDDDHPI